MVTALSGFSLSVPLGASFTAVTLIVSTLGVGSRFAPPFVISPSSRTWNVKLVNADPFWFSEARYVNAPVARSNGGANLDPTPNVLTINVTAVNDAPSGT